MTDRLAEIKRSDHPADHIPWLIAEIEQMKEDEIYRERDEE